MLYLDKITKIYDSGDSEIRALDGVTLGFRSSEFVSVLGPSGCGKTTLLNIIGGLDAYTSGDLVINGTSTRRYRDGDWDAYRNHSIGFVFQSYNLIAHQTILANVELALTLSGTPRAERRRRAKEALERVGLGNQLRKRPNQLSGGQMQRVAIARALVNDPDILLADEPTGALDSETSVQVMDMLKEIARDRLVIMVTHNPALAKEYSTRTIRLLDGRVTGDSMPLTEEEARAARLPSPAAGQKPVTSDVSNNINEETSRVKTPAKKLRSMSYSTAISLSLNNLLTKKTRTLLVSFAGSIGIIGIALILALSAGANAFIGRVEQDTLSGYPISIESSSVDYSEMLAAFSGSESNGTEHDRDAVYSDNVMLELMNTMLAGVTHNDLAAFRIWLESTECPIKNYSSAVSYSYSTPLTVYAADTSDGLRQVNPNTLPKELGLENPMMSGTAQSLAGSGYDVWSELLDNPELLATQYDVLAGRMPTDSDELVLIVNKDNEISDFILYSIGLRDVAEAKRMIAAIMNGEQFETEQVSYSYGELLNLRFTLLPPTAAFSRSDSGVWENNSGNTEYITEALAAKGTELSVVGVLRPSEGNVAASSSGGIGYLPSLTKYMVDTVNNSEIVRAQLANPETDIFTGLPFSDKNAASLTLDGLLASLGSLPEAQAAELEKSITQMKLSGMSDAAIVSALSAYLPAASDSSLEENLNTLGVSDIASPARVSIYPKDFDSKELIIGEIEKYNDSVPEEMRISYTDYVGIMMSSVTVIIDAISYILIAFVAVSLVVSSIMIGIITYISVLERTKEIGVLRAIGASKRDISRVFNAETFIIGLSAGLIGIGITILLTIPINLIIKSLTDIGNLAALPPSAAFLVLVSVLLTLVAGLVPSRIAAKKDPVVALRSE